MANDTYVQSNFNQNVWIRRDDINGQQNEIDLIQLRDTETLPTEENRYNQGCQLIVAESGAEYNNISETGTPEWVEVGGSGVNIYNADGTLTADRTVDIDGKSIVFQGQAPGFPTGDTMSMGASDDLAGFGLPSYGFSGSHTLNGLPFNYLNAVVDLDPGVRNAHYMGFLDLSGTSQEQATTTMYLVDDAGDFSPAVQSVVTGFDDLGSETTAYQGIEIREAGFVHISELDFTQNRVRVRFDRAEVNYDYDDGNVIETGSLSARSGETYIRSTYEDGGLGINNRASFEARGTGLQAEMKVQDDIFGSNSILIDQDGTYFKLFDTERMRLTETEGLVMSDTIQEKQGADITLGSKIDIQDGNAFNLTGTGVTLNFIQNENIQNGTMITLYIPSGNTVKNLASSTPPSGFTKIRLAGGVDLPTTSETILTLRLRDDTWTQITPVVEL